jgi:hypothetical protein
MQRLDLSDKELLDGAKAIAQDMRLPGGARAKLARIIDPHLSWFVAVRERGLEWTDIVQLLFKAGVTRPDGRPLSRGHVSSLVCRKQQTAQVKSAPDDAAKSRRPAPDDRGEDIPQRKVSGDRKPKDARTPTAAPHAKTARRASAANGPGGSGSHNADVLAYKQRAAKLRGK